eukprot:scaffold116609_cov39-Cyclotella_meneghiniana.AAC.4
MIDGIASTVPAASSLGPHRSIPRRDVNRDSSTNRTNSLKTTTHPSDEHHFDPEDVFRNIPTNVHPNGNSSSISDSDLDRLLGPLPSRRAALEQEDGRERKKGPGNMIVICPRCLHRGFGVVGPHWYVCIHRYGLDRTNKLLHPTNNSNRGINTQGLHQHQSRIMLHLHSILRIGSGIVDNCYMFRSGNCQA